MSLDKWKLSPADELKVEQLIADTGLRGSKELAALAQPAFRLRPTLGTMDDVPNGGSRFGGVPDVPHSFEWPVNKGHPLTFLAQLDLSQFAHSPLPSSGWLLFFYDELEFSWGRAEEDRESFRVIYVSNREAPLGRAVHPTLSEGLAPYPGRPITFHRTVCLVDRDDYIAGEALEKSFDPETDDQQWGDYYDLRQSLLRTAALPAPEAESEPEPICHLLLGHPQIVQADMRETSLCYRGGGPSGLAVSTGSGTSNQKHGPDPADWQLLLQLDSDSDNLGWMWDDMGYLYFWITKDDLERARFDRCWMVLQCY